MNHPSRPAHFALLAATALAAAGCSIPYAAPDVGGGNVCSTDGDCPLGSVCVPLDEARTCVSTSVDLPELVFEVRPAAESGKSSPSLIAPGQLQAHAGSQIINLDLDVPASVDVSPGRVFLPCGGDTPIPARVTFKPVAGLSGLLEGQSYLAESTVDAEGNDAFHVSVPPGVYDVYFEPEPDLLRTPDCASAPPIFVPRQTISKDTGFAVHASAPLTLVGMLKLSAKEDFTKWFLEVVEPYGGQTISEVVSPEQIGLALEVPFQVRFDWTASEDYTPIIRLRPPEGSGKPVIHWRLDAVALQGKSGDQIPVELDVSAIDTQPRQASGQVFHGTQPVAATVTLRSITISGDDLTRYQTVVETDQAGSFQTSLPPGDYQVIARPHGDAFAVGDTVWEIAQGDDCFCGAPVEVPSATTLAGTVTTPFGDALPVEVRLTPAGKEVLPYLGTMVTSDAVSAVQPRPATTNAPDGNFKVKVDAGQFDLSIVPASESGFPWLVRPQLLVPKPAAGGAPVVALEPFQLQNPAVVRGRVKGPAGEPLGGATVRAWIAVGDPEDGSLAPSAVQVAETVADATGTYVLLLPPSIKEGK